MSDVMSAHAYYKSVLTPCSWDGLVTVEVPPRPSPIGRGVVKNELKESRKSERLRLFCLATKRSTFECAVSLAKIKDRVEWPRQR